MQKLSSKWRCHHSAQIGFVGEASQVFLEVPSVAPAKAGAQRRDWLMTTRHWIPACVGMTELQPPANYCTKSSFGPLIQPGQNSQYGPVQETPVQETPVQETPVQETPEST